MVKLCNKPYEESDHSRFSKYSFPLSDFQKYAIDGIEQGEHVLITAKTGSGKTLPAEYAIEKYISEGKKVIYTAPIKALSNQKLRDFTEKYPNISFGILTGDIKFNPEADCLIMTTEILRNTLFQKKSIEEKTFDADKLPLHFNMDFNNELACVIFDEVHYINDTDRGKVWEETFVMLPPHVQMIMLSATIDKAEQFAGWIENIKTTPVVLASTEHRVVPLNHYGFVTIPESNVRQFKDRKTRETIETMRNVLIPLKRGDGANYEPNFHKIRKVLSEFEKEKVFVKKNFVLNEIISHLRRNNMLPAICFVFSRKQVEQFASEITCNLFEEGSKIPSIVEKECTQILRKLPNYKEYTQLREFRIIMKLLEKGIAIHHSGILPVIREMIEMLFAKGYVKVLFATETFAVGVNMPTKTVVFTGITKYHGSGFRNLLSHEYTQMAGRAGRRGLDTIGHVVHANNMFEMPLYSEYNQILNGKPPTLISKFQLHYNLILNLISNNQYDMSSFSSKSMIQNEIEREHKTVLDEIEKIQKRIAALEETLRLCKTDTNIISQYLEKKRVMHLYKNKQRRQKQREIEGIEAEYLSIIKDAEVFSNKQDLEQTLEKKQRESENVSRYLDNMTNCIVEILTKNGYISKTDEIISLTPSGIVASLIQEVFCLPWAKLYLNTMGFKEFEIEDLIGLFSCFTNISVSDETKKFVASTERDDLNSETMKLYNYYQEFYDTEVDYKLSTGADYTFHFDLMNETIKWCELDNEVDCKKLLQELYNRGIFLGEFVKAILKINNIACEFEKICEVMGNMELLQKLREIPKKTLKYVATNESLYV